jgi:hypothetical protein
MPIKQEIEAAVKAVSEIPASNRGVMELYPMTLRQQLSEELIEIIVRAVLTAAEKARHDVP